MPYETGTLKCEQAAARIAGKVAHIEGRKDGVKQRKVDSAKVIFENQMDNGSTLEQATEFVRNLKSIPNEELEEIVAMYK